VPGGVVLVGLSDAPIPWPVGKKGRAKALVVYGRLAEAVRREAAQAVAHWWGVAPVTVWLWRKALGVPAVNEGTRRLRRDYALEPAITAAREKAHAKARDPARRAKIAAARRGKPRPPNVIAALVAANTGRRLSEETRRKMSEALRRCGTRPPKAGRLGLAWEGALLPDLPLAGVARRTGRTPCAVYARRRKLRLPDGRRRGGDPEGQSAC
jgi:hypothetical protein